MATRYSVEVHVDTGQMRDVFTNSTHAEESTARRMFERACGLIGIQPPCVCEVRLWRGLTMIAKKEAE